MQQWVRHMAAAWFLAAFCLPAAAAVTAERQMVAAAHPLAAQAGLEILRAGGTALDAAVAVQAVLGLVEPQSSGLGGGGFLLHWDATRKQVTAFDGRETAPASATPELFLGADGKPMPFPKAVIGGRAVGAPGVVAMLALAHEKHGKLAWADLFAPAIHIAEQGFAVSPRLNRMLGAMKQLPNTEPPRRLYFTQSDPPTPLPTGSIVRNPDYAQSLRALAANGAKTFYSGDMARAIVEAVQRADSAGGLSLADLAAYQAKQRDPICRPYRNYHVCAMPLPTSGGVTLMQILGLLENFDMSALAPESFEAAHLFAEASRLAYADRDFYLGDSDFIDVPVKGLLDASYLRARARLMRIDRVIGPSPLSPGAPAGSAALQRAPNMAADLPSTSHFSIIDANGNAVSMTGSVEAPFGSHLMAAGFMLNNQLTDFSFVPARDGKPVANAAGPGKRPLSSMAPVLVFDKDRKLFAVLGSPGGSRIIDYVAQTLVALIDWQLDMQAAIDLPRIVDRNSVLELEAGTALEKFAPRLRTIGHKVEALPVFSGLQGIRVQNGRLEGGADKRREGVALGD